MLRETTPEGGHPEQKGGCATLALSTVGASPAPDVLAAPRDRDSVCAGDHGVILEAINTIPQVLLFHTLLTLCQRLRRASGLPSNSPKAATAHLQVNLLGPFTMTFSSPLPAPFVYTLKSAVSFTRTPLGWRPRPTARQAPGLHAVGRGSPLSHWELALVNPSLASPRAGPSGWWRGPQNLAPGDSEGHARNTLKGTMTPGPVAQTRM